MSKVISFSISDRYLAKIRSLYPSLSDNLAAKQFLTDRLDEGLSSSLLASLDDGLDDRVKTLVESWVDGLLDERLDATVGKLIGDLSERLARLESRLDDGLDGNLDDGLDDMERLLKLQREASIATSPLPPSPSLPPDKLGEGGNGDIFPDSPPSPPDQPAIEDSEKKIMESVGEPDYRDTLPVPIQGTDETVETDSSIETGTGAIETDSKPWYTVKELLDCHYPGWPTTSDKLREKAETEQWPKRTRRGSKGNPYEYQAVLPSQGKG